MKSDALTIAAVVFVVGILATSLGLTDWGSENGDEAPTELQRGFALSSDN